MNEDKIKLNNDISIMTALVRVSVFMLVTVLLLSFSIIAAMLIDDKSEVLNIAITFLGTAFILELLFWSCLIQIGHH